MTSRPRRPASRLLGAAGLTAAVLLAAGCASSPPAPSKPPEASSQPGAAEEPAARSDGFFGADRLEGPSFFGTGHALLDEAVRSIAAGTAVSLRRGIALASRADDMGAAGAAGASVVGDTLLRRLYPGAGGAGSGRGVSWRKVRLSSAFLADMAEATGLLDPSVTLDDSQLASLSRRLDAADSLMPGSPLPPFFTGLVSRKKSGPLAFERVGFETALRRSPTFWPAAAALSAAIIGAGAAPAELPLLRRLASLMPTPADRFEALARAELAGGQPGRAADAAAQGLLAVPEGTDAAARRDVFGLLRATALEQSGDWYQALWVLDGMLRLQPDLAEAQLAKARLLHEKGQNDTDALATIAEGESHHPDDASFPELRGRILQDEDKLAAATAAFTRAHELDPGRLSVIGELASLSARQGAWKAAGSWMDQVPQGSRSPEQLELAWRIDTNLDNHERALQTAERLFTVAHDPHALALESRSLLALGRPSDALRVIDRVLATQPAAPLASELHYLRSRASSDDPLRDLRSALVENPDNVEALGAMADSLAAQKDYRKAAEYARRAAFVSGDAALARKAEDLERLAENPGSE